MDQVGEIDVEQIKKFEGLYTQVVHIGLSLSAAVRGPKLLVYNSGTVWTYLCEIWILMGK